MAILPPNSDYTDLDFDAARSRLFLFIRSVFPEWTEEATANFGTILVELFAHVLDVLGFYQDKQAGEAFIVTAKLRRSVLALAKLLGYAGRRASAASVDETFTLAAPLPGAVTIPAGDRVKTASVGTPIYYRLLAPLVIPVGATSAVAPVENSEGKTASMVSTGQPNQVVVLGATPFLRVDAVAFSDGSYTEVETFLGTTSDDRIYVVSLDAQERATLRFGDGVLGKIPVGSAIVAYSVGGGAAGRVEAEALSRLERGGYIDALGNPARLSVLNAAASSGGFDRETSAQIAQNAPFALRALTRAVAREDYEIAALKVPGVARALMLTIDEGGAVGENEGVLALVPEGGGVASGLLIAAVEAQFAPGGPYPKTVTFRLRVQSAAYLVLNISAVVYRRAGFEPSDVCASVLAALASFFAIQLADGSNNPLVDFGYYLQDIDGNPTGTFAWSDLFNAIRDADGVRKVDGDSLFINGQSTDPAISAAQFPVLGTVTIFDGDTGEEMTA